MSDLYLEPLCHTTIFSKLDLRNTDHLIRIQESEEWKTAFNMPLGQFNAIWFNQCPRSFPSPYKWCSVKLLHVCLSWQHPNFLPRQGACFTSSSVTVRRRAVCETWEVWVSFPFSQLLRVHYGTRATPIVDATTWETENIIKEAQKSQPDPGRGSEGCLSVSDLACSHTLQWGHSSKLTCHPNFTEPSSSCCNISGGMVRDTREFAMSLHRGRLPITLLLACWPHSQLFMVPYSCGFCHRIATIKWWHCHTHCGDHFSKSVHFIALPKLPLCSRESWHSNLSCIQAPWPTCW